MSLAVLDGGTFYHREAIHGARYRDLFDRVIYVRELSARDLSGVSWLIVPDRINPDLLRAHRELFIAFAAAGNTLVVFGENEAETWLPGVVWASRPTNFWRWLEKGAQPPHRLTAPAHPLFQAVPFNDTIWHFHGVLTPPAGARTLVDVPAEGEYSAGALLYEDDVTTRGRFIVSTLDPFYHHGSGFMPATTRFLDAFLPWARRQAARDAAAPQEATSAGVSRRSP